MHMSKVAIVTGAAKGLGREIVIALTNQGYTCVIHYNKSKKEADALLRLIKKRSPDSFTISTNLKKEKDVDVMFRKIYSIFPKIDLLVNNVGNFLYKKFSETSNEEFRDLIESNIYSTIFTSRAVLSTMRRRKRGIIVNIGAVGADNPKILEKSTVYYIAKTAVYSLTKIMAWEESRNGIHVNMISPASLANDIFQPSDFPMGRSPNYDDVIKALLFLISDDAYYINGANIEVAGGFIPGMK